MIDKPERFELRLDKATLDRIDSWRSDQPDVPSRAEAVRRLVSKSLDANNGRRLYELARFQLLASALTSEVSHRLPHAYVFAWERGVYPCLDEGAQLHAPFESYFRVGAAKVDELLKYLDDCWTTKKVPTFYEVEDYFQVRFGRSGWDRGMLVSACRYMYLHDSFDANFWKKLLSPTQHPAEASSIPRKFIPAKDLFFT